MGVFLIIAGLLILVAVGIFAVKDLRAFAKEAERELSSQRLRFLAILGGIAGIGGGVILNLGFALAGVWSIDPGHYVMLFAGGIAFFAAVYAFLVTFYLRYWRTDLPENQKKKNNVVMLSSIAAMFVGFLLAGEGMAPYLTYPLVSGFCVNGTGFHWIRPGESHGGGLTINWYGILIVSGAVLAYKLSDHNFYKKYGRHGILDTCFLIAFPAGIIGARIWYVVGNWNVVDIYVNELGGTYSFAQLMGTAYWWKIFALWEGGLTILGGAIFGITVGMIYALTRRKYVDIRFAFDAVVPNILLAQAIGRFGNFFNREVYGAMTSASQWPLLPSWLRNNMAVGFFDGLPADGNMYVPLFIIEAVLNVVGFFVITRLIPLLWKKTRPLGANFGLYMMWYGIVRIIMEPLRDPNYNMGNNGMWSVWNSMVYIILGVGLLILMLVIGHVRKKKGLPLEYPDDPKFRAKLLKEAGVEEDPAEAKEDPLAVPKPIQPKTAKKADDLAAPKPIGKKKEDDLAAPRPIKKKAEETPQNAVETPNETPKND